jgi:hypothetical protein
MSKDWKNLTDFHRIYILTQGKYNIERLKKIGNAIYLPRAEKDL